MEAATEEESRVRLRTEEATEPESVVESSPDRRVEEMDGEGRALVRCFFVGVGTLLVAGGRFWAPPARDAEIP